MTDRDKPKAEAKSLNRHNLPQEEHNHFPKLFERVETGFKRGEISLIATGRAA